MSEDVSQGSCDCHDLREQVRYLQWQAELAELPSRYCLAVDDRDWDALRRLYAPDAEYEGPLGVVRGRDAVVDYLKERMAPWGPSFHAPHAQTFEIVPGGTTARGQVTAHAEIGIGEERVVTAMRYEDDYGRDEDGRWVFRSRQLRFLYVTPDDGLGSIFQEGVSRKRWPGTQPAPADLPEWDHSDAD